MINIYFAGSIRGGRDIADTYRELIRLLRSFGKVYTEHVGDDGAIRHDDDSLSDNQIHDRDMEWIRESDLMIAEVSVPSLGVGYEIARAIELEKPVLCLYNKNSRYRLSAMVSGNNEIKLIRYESPGEVKNLIEKFILGNLETPPD